jgi:beta-xylosidase
MKRKNLIIVCLLILCFFHLSANCKREDKTSTTEKYSRFKPGQLWTDEDGVPIQSHFGSVFYDDGVYYWVGQNYIGGPTIPRGSFPNQPFTWNFNTGISIYSSTDLYNWKLKNIVLNETSFEPQSLLQPLNLIGRVNIIKNDMTGKYILMGVLLSPDFLTINDVVYAISDSPVGPFEFKGKLKWKNAPNLTEDIWDSEKLTGKRDSPERIRGWDMELFKDEDNRAYLIVGHGANYIYELSDDYTSVLKGALMEGVEGEAPAMIKDNNTYYIFESQLTGYQANSNTYFTSDNIWGPWEPRGKFARGKNEETTFESQVAHVFPLVNCPGKFIFISGKYNEVSGGDIPDLQEIKHIWLPLDIDRKSKSVQVNWRDEWTLDELE